MINARRSINEHEVKQRVALETDGFIIKWSEGWEEKERKLKEREGS